MKEILVKVALASSYNSSEIELTGSNTNEQAEIMSSTSREAQFMRPIAQNFKIESFSPEESVKIIFDGIEVQIKEQVDASKPIGENIFERTHIFSNFSRSQTKVKLVLFGNSKNRPAVHSLKVVVT